GVQHRGTHSGGAAWGGGVRVRVGRQPWPVGHGRRDTVTSADNHGVPAAEAGLGYASGPGAWGLGVTGLGAAMATIDATVVGIALPAIGRDFGAGLTALQWVVMSYTLTLAGLLLFAGALGDRYGRKRIFLAGVVWFAMASLVCGFAPSVALLI